MGAEELFEYFKGRAKAYGIDEFVHLRHEVLGCQWREDSDIWHVTICDSLNNRDFVDTADIVINACGFLKYVSASLLRQSIR